MVNLLYKTKGLRSSHNGIMIFCDIVLLVLGIAGIFVSQMKHAIHTASFRTSSGTVLGSGSFGGGYIFKEEAKNTIIIISVILIVLALLYLEAVIVSNKSYINVFDNHIEAMQCFAFIAIIKKPTNLTYDKIIDVEYIKPSNALNTDKLVLYTNCDKRVIVVKESETAYEIIKSKIATSNKSYA